MPCNLRFSAAIIMLSLIAGPETPARQTANHEVAPQPNSAPAEAGDQVAGFARMLGGEWKMTVESGKSMYDTWHWGPGKHSLRVMTQGEDAQGNPWRAIQAVYWHPGRERICLWGLNPYAQSVEEGTITLEPETAEAIYDLYQAGGRRTIARRWTFDGRDRYRSALLEAVEPGRFVPLVEFVYVRSQPHTKAAPVLSEKAPEFPARLKALESLQGRPWEAPVGAKDTALLGAAAHIRSAIEWIPYADGIYVSVHAASADGEPEHVLDAYIYHHTGARALRCLALSSRGGVYEGDVDALDGGSLQAELKGREGDREALLVVRLDREVDGTIRQRLWSSEGDQRTLMLDVHHKVTR